MVPPPMDMDEEAAQPHKKRNARNMAVFELKAQPTVKPT
jgi:hypothetical protein